VPRSNNQRSLATVAQDLTCTCGGGQVGDHGVRGRAAGTQQWQAVAPGMGFQPSMKIVAGCSNSSLSLIIEAAS
jgi:hypothetical protein